MKAPIKIPVFLLLSHFIISFPLAAQDWKLTTENIQRAFEAQAKAISRDTLQPAYHLVPPAGGMGDPNGGIYYEDRYHIFYGLQPFSSSLGGWFWAHARSRDLMHWEHMVPGLVPAFELGLDHVGSGSTIVSEKGERLAFYSTGQDGTMKFWRAEFKNDLTGWRHQGKNPVLTLDHPGLPGFDSFWRDPFVFTTGGRTFLIACADLLDEDYVPVPIFEAMNDELTEWDYKGILFTWPKHELRNLEVPELRPLGDKWIFLASSDAPVDRTYYFLGDFDQENLKFNPMKNGVLDYSGHYYAQETILDPKGDLYVMAWIPGWDRPWLPDFRENDLKNSSAVRNGCFALPRQLMLDPGGNLVQKPVESVEQLRTDRFYMGIKELPVHGPEAEYDVLGEIRGNKLEISLEMNLNAASFCGLNVLCDDQGKGGLYIIWSGNMINVDGVRVPMDEWELGQNLQLRIFIDKQIVEVFIDGGKYCVTRLVKPENIRGDRIALTRLGGHAILNHLEAWKLKSIN